MSQFGSMPLPIIGILILLFLFLGVELGYRGHGWLKRRGDKAQEDGPDHLLTAVLGLLALLLGFTFSLSLNRYEARRALVVQEANAIGTTWLRVQLLNDADRAAISQLLRDYTKARIAWSDADDGDDHLERTNLLQRQLWAAAGNAIRSESTIQLPLSVTDSMTQSFDAASARVAARSAHIPDRVLSILLIYAFLSMTMLGYNLATNGRPHRVATTLLLILMTLALVVILDLDRSRSGAIMVSQQPLEDLRSSFQ